jgi:hypothetical protein
MFNTPKQPDYIGEGLEKQRIDEEVKVYERMLDEILDDYLDGRITKLTMEDMMKWCCVMLKKAKVNKDG